jgi:hypothetical protein
MGTSRLAMACQQQQQQQQQQQRQQQQRQQRHKCSVSHKVWGADSSPSHCFGLQSAIRAARGTLAAADVGWSVGLGWQPPDCALSARPARDRRTCASAAAAPFAPAAVCSHLRGDVGCGEPLALHLAAAAAAAAAPVCCACAAAACGMLRCPAAPPPCPPPTHTCRKDVFPHPFCPMSP